MFILAQYAITYFWGFYTVLLVFLYSIGLLIQYKNALT